VGWRRNNYSDENGVGSASASASASVNDLILGCRDLEVRCDV